MHSKTSFDDPIELYRALKGVWAADTASPPMGWAPNNPAKNHCSVTALIVQDHFGGDILTTQTPDGVHFYNRFGGRTWDLTIEQFSEPIAFEDKLVTRDFAMADTTPEKYAAIYDRLTTWPKL